MVQHLCVLAGVSRSGYYRYFSEEAANRRQARHQEDEKVKEVILKAFHFRGRSKGARQIKMTLEDQFKITYNLKLIRHYEEVSNHLSYSKGESLSTNGESDERTQNITEPFKPPI